MPARKWTLIYACALLALHLAHVTEEVLGNFFLIDRMGGLGVFLVVNVIAIAAIMAVMISFWRGRPWATRWMKAWAVVEILNGAGHNIAQRLAWFKDLSTPGRFTGIGLFVTAILVLYCLGTRGQSGVRHGEPS